MEDHILRIELGRTTDTTCGCCGKLSHTYRGFVYEDDVPTAVYFAGFTEEHTPEMMTFVVSRGDWSEKATPKDRQAVVMRMRVMEGQPQVMVVGPKECPWGDLQVAGRMLDRKTALARPDIQSYFHVVDHVLAEDPRIQAFYGSTEGET